MDSSPIQIEKSSLCYIDIQAESFPYKGLDINSFYYVTLNRRDSHIS